MRDSVWRQMCERRRTPWKLRRRNTGTSKRETRRSSTIVSSGLRGRFAEYSAWSKKKRTAWTSSSRSGATSRPPRRWRPSCSRTTSSTASASQSRRARARTRRSKSSPPPSNDSCEFRLKAAGLRLQVRVDSQTSLERREELILTLHAKSLLPVLLLALAILVASCGGAGSEDAQGADHGNKDKSGGMSGMK